MLSNKCKNLEEQLIKKEDLIKTLERNVEEYRKDMQRM
jgi:hypothetical protein